MCIAGHVAGTADITGSATVKRSSSSAVVRPPVAGHPQLKQIKSADGETGACRTKPQVPPRPAHLGSLLINVLCRAQ